jgi:hypothetical protein
MKSTNPKRADALKKSELITTGSRKESEKYLAKAQEDRDSFAARHNLGMLTEEQRKEQERQAQVLFGFQQVQSGLTNAIESFETLAKLPTVSEVTLNLQSFTSPTSSSSSSTVRMTQTSHPKDVRNISTAQVELQTDNLELTLQKMQTLLLKDDPELQAQELAIIQLENKRNNFKPHGTSSTDYKRMCDEAENDAVLHVEPSALANVLRHLRENRDPYEVWKAKIEQQNKNAITKIESQIANAKAKYEADKDLALKALMSYEQAYERRYQQLAAKGLSDEEIARNMNISFANKTDFALTSKRNASLALAKSIAHPCATGLVQVITSGNADSTTGWNDMQRFFAYPLPTECFIFNVGISTDIAHKLQTIVTGGSDPTIKLALKMSKALWSASPIIPPNIKLAGVIAFEASDYVLSIDFAKSKLSAWQSNLESSIDKVRQIIPRVAGSNEETLKSMYVVVNESLNIIKNDPQSSPTIKSLINRVVLDNYTLEQKQLEDIRSYNEKRATNKPSRAKCA